MTTWDHNSFECIVEVAGYNEPSFESDMAFTLGKSSRGEVLDEKIVGTERWLLLNVEEVSHIFY